MQKIKIFYCNDNLDNLEKKINKWINKTPRTIINILQTQSHSQFSGACIAITIYYENI